MYMLDTNICIYIITKKSEKLLKRIEKEKAFSLAVSTVTVAELEYGTAKSLHTKQNRTTLMEFLGTFKIISFTAGHAEVYGIIRAYLEKLGTPIGPYDLQIAAQCLADGHTLVTNNTREFERVPELKLENWT